MIEFESVTLKNFMSYGAVPTTIPLTNIGTTSLVGNNKDHTTDGEGGNGTGKTSIINALSVGVFDKAITNIQKDNLINNINKKEMQLIVKFRKSGKLYFIERARKMKAGADGNYVKLYEDVMDSDHDITPASMSATNEKIERLIGIPHELFIRVVTFSATQQGFFNLPVRHASQTNQSDVIEELFDIKILSHKSKVLSDDRKNIKKMIEVEKEKNNQLTKSLEAHESLIASTQGRVIKWEQERVTKIETIQAGQVKLQDVNIEEQQDLHNQLTSINNKITNASAEKHEAVRRIKQSSMMSDKRRKEIEQLEEATCPYCNQSFSDNDEKIDECRAIINDSDELLNEFEINLTTAINILKQLELKKDKALTKITIANIDDVIKIKNESSQYEKKLGELEAAENPHLEPLEELEAIDIVRPSLTKTNKLTKKLEHLNFLLKLLTKKDSFVRKILLSKNIPFLNGRLSGYLTELGLVHKVEFTQEMTAKISQFGRELDFGNLSHGQQSRVNLALSFAFRDVLESLHDKINVCLFDEVLDEGLDAVGVQAAAKLLKRKAKDEKLTFFIISHRKDEISGIFDHKMVVEMKNGFSHIKGDVDE